MCGENIDISSEYRNTYELRSIEDITNLNGNGFSNMTMQRLTGLNRIINGMLEKC